MMKLYYIVNIECYVNCSIIHGAGLFQKGVE